MDRQNILILSNDDIKPAPRDMPGFSPTETKIRHKRLWEAANHTASFYIPPHIKERAKNVQANLKSISEEEVAYVDQISHELMRYGIVCYQRGDIQIETRPTAETRKLALVWEETEDGEPIDLNETKKSVEKNVNQKFRAISYRWHDDTYALITEVATLHGANTGEILILFLEHAIQKYIEGRLVLKKIQPIITNNITGWKEKK